MPRPPRCRRVCSLPAASVFGPVDGGQSADAIIMGIDEYEVIRLIDWVGLTQEQCAAQINVARTTVTGIYDSARRKLADASSMANVSSSKAAISKFVNVPVRAVMPAVTPEKKNTKENDPNE